jgi:hypothetical protein
MTLAVTVAYIRVNPGPEAQPEADDSAMSVTYHYGDRSVKVWQVCDDEDAEGDEVALTSIIWKQLESAADWFLCRENGKRIEAGFAISHGSHVWVRYRDEADTGWWHRSMSEMTMKVTPPSHWIEDEEEDDCDKKDISQVETELRSQASILKGHCAETKSALVSWNGKTKQMFFNPDHAIEELSSQIQKYWGTPEKGY